MRASKWLLTAAVLSLVQHVYAGGVAVLSGPAPDEFHRAAQAAGFSFQEARGHWPAQADVAVIETDAGWNQALPIDPKLLARLPMPGGQRALDADVANMLADAPQRLREGKTLIVSLGRRAGSIAKGQTLLPVNIWTVSDDLIRGNSGASVPAGSPLADLQWTGFAVASRYDLHLPYAAIEAGEHRYRFQDYGQAPNGDGPFPSLQKELANTDWRVLLSSDQAGRLPLIVEGRYHAGRVIVFGANLYDPALVNWDQYNAFVARLLGTPSPAPAKADDVAALTVSIPAVQTGASDTLRVNVANGGDKPLKAVLLCKISNGEHGLLNSVSLPINVPASASQAIDVPVRSAAIGDAAIHASADENGYRIVDAGICGTDYGEVASTATTIVDITPPVTLAVHTQDYRSFDDLAKWPDREMAPGYIASGAAPIDRYVFDTGSAAQITVRLGNALHNIAPLAVASDVDHPQNISAQGLNDGSFSSGSIRGLWPLYGGWYAIAAPQQQVALKWPSPVTITASEVDAYGNYRQWYQSNPPNYQIVSTSGGAETTLADVSNVTYTLCAHRDAFKPTAADSCALRITGITAKPRNEPGALPGQPSNCSIQEWQLFGWPATTLPPAVEGHLVVTQTDLLTAEIQPLLDEHIKLDPVTEAIRPITLPAHAGEGPVRIDVTFTPQTGPAIHDSTSVLFVAPDRKKLTQTPKSTFGLLCAPGFQAIDPFGLGTSADTQGWGGPDNNVWTVTHDLMELGAASSDDPRRMLTTAARFCHYTDPWRDFPSGQYYFDFATDRMLAMLDTPAMKEASYFRVFLSDRWNGIPIGSQFTWDDFIRFDEYLRQKTGKGLAGRTRKELTADIRTNHADEFQVFELNRYADHLLDAQKRFAEKGVDFSVTTHGSFPLVGGEIGQKIAKTHRSSGTDVFWDLRREDLFGTLGWRFGLIAANPDFESGMYNEWGWTNSRLNNMHWFSYVGTSEPARRQWYATYFMGRVDSNGALQPLTMSGCDAQGGFSVKIGENDWQHYYRTQQFTTKNRPESAAGIGLVASWAEQMRHMGKQAGELGTGYYAAAGYDQIDQIAGRAWSQLVKNGLPMSFVASTDTLKQWNGTQPLVVVDGLSYTPEEIATLQRLADKGVPLIAVGGGSEATDAALQFFGLRKTVDGFAPLEDAKPIQTNGRVIAYAGRHANGSVTLACPAATLEMSDSQCAELADAVRQFLGDPIAVSPGITTGAFISGGQLYVALTDQGDVNRNIDVSIRPSLLAPGQAFTHARVIDLDRSVEIPVKNDNGQLTFSLPCAASDGRMILITTDGKTP